jgi:hypothetical protein
MLTLCRVARNCLTEKDWEDIKFGVDNKVDYYALSFVKDAEVVHELKDFLKGLVLSMIPLSSSISLILLSYALTRVVEKTLQIKLLSCCRSWS